MGWGNRQYPGVPDRSVDEHLPDSRNRRHTSAASPDRLPWDGGIVNIPAFLIVVLMSIFLIRGTEG
ncbi:hypothetical protein E7X19_26805, partial [Bacteroides fragilis]